MWREVQLDPTYKVGSAHAGVQLFGNGWFVRSLCRIAQMLPIACTVWTFGVSFFMAAVDWLFVGGWRHVQKSIGWQGDL